MSGWLGCPTPAVSPAQLVIPEVQFGDAAVVVSADAFPLANRHVAQPVIVATPIRAASGRYRGRSGLPGPFRARSAPAGVRQWPWAWATVRRFPLSARVGSVQRMSCSPAHRWPARGCPIRRFIRAAAGQQQQRQNQRQGKDSQKKSWRSHLDSLPMCAGARWDGAARPNPSTRRGIACSAPGTAESMTRPVYPPGVLPVRLRRCR